MVVSVLFGKRYGKKMGKILQQLGVGIVNADKPMQLVPSGQDSDKIQKIENESMENETCLNSQHAVVDFGLVFLLPNPS